MAFEYLDTDLNENHPFSAYVVPHKANDIIFAEDKGRLTDSKHGLVNDIVKNYAVTVGVVFSCYYKFITIINYVLPSIDGNYRVITLFSLW